VTAANLTPGAGVDPIKVVRPSKRNLRSVPPRRNRRRVEDPDNAFVRGLAAGVAEMHRQLIADGDSAGVRSVIRAAGLTLDRMRAAGVSPIDLRRLRRAGVR
jgi:hypothetical protein